MCVCVCYLTNPLHFSRIELKLYHIKLTSTTIDKVKASIFIRFSQAHLAYGSNAIANPHKNFLLLSKSFLIDTVIKKKN